MHRSITITVMRDEEGPYSGYTLGLRCEHQGQTEIPSHWRMSDDREERNEGLAEVTMAVVDLLALL